MVRRKKKKPQQENEETLGGEKEEANQQTNCFLQSTVGQDRGKKYSDRTTVTEDNITVNCVP